MQASGKELAIKPGSAEYIEQGRGGLCRVVAEAPSWREPKIQVLKLVGLQIHRAKDKRPRTKVEVITNAAALCVGGHHRLTGNFVAGVQRSKIDFDLIARSCASSVRTYIEVVSGGVAPGGSVS